MAFLLAVSLPVACGGGPGTPSNQLVPGETTTIEVRGVTAHVRLDGDAIVEGKNAFLVDLDPGAAVLTGASLLMPAHGHGSPTPTITRAATGYLLSDVIFTMPGLWYVFLDVELAGTTERLQFSVDVP